MILFVDVRNGNGALPISVAVQQTRLRALVVFLLAWPGAAATMNTKTGNYLLHDAVIATPSGSTAPTQLAQLLYDAWPDGVKAKVAGGRAHTPLFLACVMQREEMMLLLLSWWPEGAQVDSMGMYPIHMCVCQSGPSDVRLRCCTAVLKAWPKGAQVGGSGGNLPLHLAVLDASAVAVRLFLESYPEGKAAKNRSGDTPADLANKYKRNVALRILEDHTKEEEEERRRRMGMIQNDSPDETTTEGSVVERKGAEVVPRPRRCSLS